VAARGSAPVLGALCLSGHPKPNPEKGTSGDEIGPPVADEDRVTPGEVRKSQPWAISFGYRFAPSSRAFLGTIEQVQPPNRPPLENIIHLLDISIERQLTKRFSVTASLPIQYGYRNQTYAPVGEFRVNSIGDMTVGGRTWLFRPPTESGANVAVGMSLKLPTGKYDATGIAKNARGQTVLAPADQSIQAGDGGTGLAVDIQAYRPIWFKSMVYFTGSYLFNPRDTNGVSSGRLRFRETINSVPDQYLARGGIARAVPRIPGLVVTFGGRIEGVPVRDLLGESNGFRRPGYQISGDPGFLYARWGYVFSCSVPWAIERNLRRSVPEIANGFRDGDSATFPDYILILGISRRF